MADYSLVPVGRSGTDPSGCSGPSPSEEPRRSIIDMPPEVVLIIFQSFLPSVDHKSLRRSGTCRSYMMDLCTLRLVSTSWRELLDTTASFWVVISSTFPWSVNDTNITRSCNAPLIVHFDTDPPLYRSPTDTWHNQALERFLKLLGHTKDRWRVVWLERYSPDTVPQYLASAAAVIETVRLSDTYGSPSFHLLGGEFETQKIQHLDLNHVLTHWDRFSFCRLKSLRLRGNVGEGITTDLLLEVLANNPSLEDLKVTDVDIQLSKTPSSPTIRFLQLQSIELRSLGPDILDRLLRHVEAPHCQEISIQGMYNPAFNFSFILEESLRSFESVLSELHKKNGSSKFIARPGRTEWRSQSNNNDPPRFDILAHGISLASSLRWVERVLENMDPEGLEVMLKLDRGEAMGDPEVMSTLHRLRCVTHINTSNPENSRGIVDLLCGPDVPSSQNAVPPLPSLRWLSMSYEYVTAKEILHMARARFANSPHTTFKVHDLEISPSSPRLMWSSPSTIFNFTTITEIRSIDGVTLHTHIIRLSVLREGMLAVVWDEEMGEPTWG
ncbi:hypothetical protein FRC04_006726 [Tulasnella sp. 424]|nr:hypothetical protein FRC04_006726 [Tulasnella sp. 424]KAG8960593.1 hypothetical protein FRC05_006728 [Tulasnella sp. 425]